MKTNKPLNPWKSGDAISAKRLNAGERQSPTISVTPPLTVKQFGDVLYLGMDRRFDSRVARISARSSDFTDNRYYARPCNFTNSAGSASDILTFEDYGSPASDYEEAVQNFSEPSDSHLLRVGQPVILFRRQDDSPVDRYFINQTPPLCVASDWDTYSDISDLSEYVWDATYDLPARANISDLASDLSLVFVKGSMYKAQESDVNPWVVMKLPLCVDKDYPRASDISDLSISDITASPTDTGSDVYLVTGHFYRDVESDLNPWFVFKMSDALGPGPVYLDTELDLAGCWVTNLRIDRHGRTVAVQKDDLSWYDLDGNVI